MHKICRSELLSDLLDNTFRIDLTDVRAHPNDDHVTWNYDLTTELDETENERKESDDSEDSYYYGYSCLIAFTGPKLPIAAGFTQRK
jgi:hypothetical protein